MLHLYASANQTTKGSTEKYNFSGHPRLTELNKILTNNIQLLSTSVTCFMHLLREFRSQSFQTQFLKFQNFHKLQRSVTREPQVQSLSSWVSLESLSNILSGDGSALLLLFPRNCCSKAGQYCDPPADHRE